MNNQSEQALSWTFNVPNGITTLRIILAACIAWLLVAGGTGQILLAAILLTIGWASDGLDGLLARRLGQSSPFGEVFDLIADRVLMTPTLILAVSAGLFSGTAALMPLNPYPYAVIVIAGDLTILAGIIMFMRKRRTQAIVFPTPTRIAKLTYSFQMLTLVVALVGMGPDILLASLMYLAIIFTLLSFYSYLRKGGYVFTP